MGAAVAVSLAAALPSVGRPGGPLRPELTVAWGATCGIFVLTGLALPTHELAAAARRVREHALIQGYNLAFMPLATVLACGAATRQGLLEPALRDGMVAMACCPTTINMCVALTRSAGGDVGLAVFNAVLGNLLGVFLTPLLLLRLLGSTGSVSAAAVLRKLASKVILPLAAGQLARRLLPRAALEGTAKKRLSRGSETLLLLIIYATFCETFSTGWPLRGAALARLFVLVLLQHLGFLATGWALGGAAGLAAPQRTAFTLCSTQKTLALGLPLLQVVFAGRPDLALICTPLLIQHPLQLLVGSVNAPRLVEFAEAEQQGESRSEGQ